MEVLLRYKCHFLCISPQWCSSRLYHSKCSIYFAQERLHQVFCFWLWKKPYQDNLCMFRALAYDLYGSVHLQQKTMELMQMFLSATRRDDETFPGIHEDDIPVLEALVDRNIQVYSIFFDEESEMFAEITRRSSMKRIKTTSLLRYENHICWTADINKFLKKFRCYVCDHFFDRSNNLEVHMRNCSEKTKHHYPSGAYQLSETIFERLEDVNINVPQELRLFCNLIVFDFESITVPDNTLRNTELTSWIGKHVPISVCEYPRICFPRQFLFATKIRFN